eukprot:5354700-Lingulodinium_polyedra.AAC.1
MSRPPLPWLAVAGLAHELLRGPWPLMAVAVLLMFGCYLRPSECLRLKGFQLLRPAAEMEGWAGRCWGLVLCAEELAQ